MQRAIPTSDTDRGQAYTLEGFVSAMIVLIAILFALQSVVITPTTGGLADRTVKAQMEQEAQDALVISANDTENKSLSETIRAWNDSEDTFEKADITSEDVRGHYNASNRSHFYKETALGEILHERFAERGMSYNVELVYRNGTEYESEYLVYQGEAEAVTASYFVMLYENQTLLPEENQLLGDLNKDHPYPIPPGPGTDDSEIYNVVEVRVAVW